MGEFGGAVGSHQFQRPRMAIREGTRMARTMVASAKCDGEAEFEFLEADNAAGDEAGVGGDHDDRGGDDLAVRSGP